MDAYKLLYDQLNTAEKSHIEWNCLTQRTSSRKQESDLYEHSYHTYGIHYAHCSCLFAHAYSCVISFPL